MVFDSHEPVCANHISILQSYVGGCWVNSSGDRLHLLADPNTEQNVGHLVPASLDCVGASIAAANEAFADWSVTSRRVRADILKAMIDGIAARQGTFAQTISQEIGSPIDFARNAQVGTALNHLRAIRDALLSNKEDTLLANDPQHRVRYEPIGVAGLITPWNWPLNQVVLKVGAALAAGCTVVLKPSEFATRTAVLFAEVLADIDLPPGVFNLLVGDAQTGEALVSDPGVSVVSFTGSSKAGSTVASIAARHFARTSMELGGKSPNLVFADCDIETALRQGLAHCFRNSGQSCNAASRMLVERPIYEQAIELAGQIANEMRVGRPSEEGPHLGPLVNQKQFQRVQTYLSQGVTSGARLLAGGPGRPPGLETGFYVRPTVFADVGLENRLFREEIFGPVLTMTPFCDEDQAISLANASDYGLAAYIQTSCESRADRVSRRLRAGMIQVNGTSRAQGAPFGGYKASGNGREAGLWGLRAFQEIKSISGSRFFETPS